VIFYTRQVQNFSVPRNTTDYQRTISCLDGDIAVSGGFSTNNNVEVYRSAPIINAQTGKPNGWSVLFKNPTSTLYGASISVTCQDVP
jgi:thiamine biosynthesis lipoprotein ApbE